MAGARPGPSIVVYALGMVTLVLLAFLGYAALTYGEFQRMRADRQEISHAAAKKEIEVAMDHLRRKAEMLAERFAASEAVDEQLLRSRALPYWHDQRRIDTSLLSPAVEGSEIYGRDGHALTPPDGATMPRRIPIPPPTSRVEFVDEQPAILVFRAVPGVQDVAHLEPRGYIGLRVRFLRELREARNYQYVDPQTIRFLPGTGSMMTRSDLHSAVKFSLREHPAGEAVTELLFGMIRNLSIVVAVLLLALYPALVLLIVRPLQAISKHVDRLKGSPGGLMLDSLPGVLPIAETEKIRESLNAYQEQLGDVHSSLEEKSQELWAMAHHDAATGAKNRRAFDEFMQNFARSLGGHDVEVCFALFDVNHFKAINDTYGHGVGDKVLKVTAERIRAVLRKDEELFRIGGDEFAVILLDCDETAGLRIAERCHEKIVGYDFTRLGIREPLRISAGLANARIDDIDDLQSLQWKADAAMYRAKRPGQANVVMFSEALARDSEGLFSTWVNTAVYDAVVYGKGLTMHYQPIVDLETGAVCHYEALVRISQDGELIQPSNIFPVVEARRLEVELDRAVIRQVMGDLEAGKVAPGTGVSINLSGPTLVHEQVCDWLAGFQSLLGDYRVMIEVTETALITQIGLANDNLARLRDHGFEIALDDFGSGYSSVRYLANMPVGVVKFDISLIQGLRDETQGSMVLHLAQMILASGHRLVAEGIEDAATLDVVRESGFVLGQGYLMGRPTEQAQLTSVRFDNVAQFPNNRCA